jgi:hypothetical protein
MSIEKPIRVGQRSAKNCKCLLKKEELIYGLIMDGQTHRLSEREWTVELTYLSCSVTSAVTRACREHHFEVPFVIPLSDSRSTSRATDGIRFLQTDNTEQTCNEWVVAFWELGSNTTRYIHHGYSWFQFCVWYLKYSPQQQLFCRCVSLNIHTA